MGIVIVFVLAPNIKKRVALGKDSRIKPFPQKRGQKQYTISGWMDGVNGRL